MSDVLTLLVVGLVSGVVTALSPCVLPVLPVVLAASTTAPDGSGRRKARRRPYVVVAALVTTFAVATVAGSALLSALGLPQDVLRWAGIVVLAVAGLTLLVPRIAEIVQVPFERLPMRAPKADAPAVVLGASFGLVFVPCAGPVLAAITVLSATEGITLDLFVLTLGFAIGVGLPLLGFAIAGSRMFERIKAVRTRAPLVRRIAGLVMLASSLALAFDLTSALQRTVPGYVEAAQERIEDNEVVGDALDDLTTSREGASGFDACAEEPGVLRDCGVAPDFDGIEAWLNTPDEAPLSLAELRGKVVLVDFWTYSCINCQRTLPYLRDWHERYAEDGLVVVGVHTPEFAFEREVRNVRDNVDRLDVDYPVAIDNGYETWTAYGNRYWPSHYLVDADGQVRQVHYGEGAYDETEDLIRELLSDAGARDLADEDASDDAPGLTEGRTPETYLGSNRLERVTNEDLALGELSTYTLSDDQGRDTVSFGGGWTIGPQSAQSGADAALRLAYRARTVHLVVAGTGSVVVSRDGEPLRSFDVEGSPRLYTLVDDDEADDGLLEIRLSPDLQAYAFSFG